ncbi:CheR family methyltransferase [Streptomyces cylindrosporus]|uniref:protein-glutamate O-methyltransferase n=1 Tax=Streptomyces cylindrosporus TaxID=2927583 RepID=A0ABS9YBM6_9ACTN|nr:protein-glutamate O-methyltransferase CheR [Streptomyces cylindrosporus]MCI3273955.1 protein-glutamate O-methyltransferase CheR [Streptomyces cylindrosporus]
MGDAQRVTESDRLPDEWGRILDLLRRTRGFTFTGYKHGVLERSVSRRMAVLGITSYTAYRQRLAAGPGECDLLLRALLIGTTSFFRDPSAWDYLRREVVPELLEESVPGREIRVWSAGCARGEEAYSLAILFAEAIGRGPVLPDVRIFATDVDPDALQVARSGLYPGKAVTAMPSRLRDTYLTPQGDQYRIRSGLRCSVVFGRHDIMRDVPLSGVDLLVCRNTLMYFDTTTQAGVLDGFRFALRGGGFLFLGRAETLAIYGHDTFVPVERRQRVYRRLPDGPAATEHRPAAARRRDRRR